MTKRLEAGLEALLGALSAALLLMLLATVIANVILRYGFQSGFVGIEDLGIWLHVALIAIASPLALKGPLSMRFDVGLRLTALRIDTRNDHGTGCTLAAAVTAHLAHGMSLVEAAREAKRYLHAALVAGTGLRVGQGRGPVHHFHGWWPA